MEQKDDTNHHHSSAKMSKENSFSAPDRIDSTDVCKDRSSPRGLDNHHSGHSSPRGLENHHSVHSSPRGSIDHSSPRGRREPEHNTHIAEAKPETRSTIINNTKDTGRDTLRVETPEEIIQHIREDKVDSEFEELMHSPNSNSSGEVTFSTDPIAQNILSGFKM